MARLRVLLSTSWGTACGIAEHSACLKAAVEAADPEIEIIPHAEALDPRWVAGEISEDQEDGGPRWDLIHLNHHDALHSRWTPSFVEDLRDQARIPTLVTYHDTREKLSDCSKLAAMAAVASATVVHEPVEGLEGPTIRYWRQGVPPPATSPEVYEPHWEGGFSPTYHDSFKAFPQQPVLGTVGFNFPWKNYDALARLTGEEGWALVLLANDATSEDVERWTALNPSTLVVPEFLPQSLVLNFLAGCDATVFYYTCANTGTSGAIRQGIAARRSVLAYAGCRQFRDLREDRLGQQAIQWFRDLAGLRTLLQRTLPLTVDPLVHALAEQDSWTQLGKKYAGLYQVVTGTVAAGQTVGERG